MKFNIKWLQDFAQLNLNPDQLAKQLTDIGLEVEDVEGDVLEVSVPPNRADCLGVVGIAREAAAANNLAFVNPQVKPIPAAIQDKLTVKVVDPKICSKYLSRVIRGVDNTKSTPTWMQERLMTAGIKSISPVVDVTNYVLIEYGQPLHAYDLSKLDGGIVVRPAKDKEKLVLLDDTELTLEPDTLVIADNNKAISIAGIMGGKDSGITNQTKDIVLESAFFDPIEIRLTARKLKVQSDSSYRFERCIDVSMREAAIERATELLLQIVGGQAGPIVEFVSQENIPATKQLELRTQRITRILGIEVPTQTVLKILNNLGMQAQEKSNGVLQVTVPTFRSDITREIDLVEEITRVYGYQNIPDQIPYGSLVFNPQPEEIISEGTIINCLLDRGYNEAITYSFIAKEFCEQFVISDSINDELFITNPISAEMSLMRPTLLPGLMNALLYNQNRQQDRVRLFEIGLRFIGSKANLHQIKTIAGVCSGNYYPEGWANGNRKVDFFDVKADIFALFALSNSCARIEFKDTEDPALHPGQALDVFVAGIKVGKLGALHPSLLQKLGIITPVVVFELDYEAIASGSIVNFQTFSKFPAVRRDLALLVDKQIQYAKLEQAIRKIVGKLLTELVIFDVYQGKGISDDKKSVAIGITLQDNERTLTDAEVNDVFAQVVTNLEREFGATLR